MTTRVPRLDELDHITLPVADLHTAEKFYVGVLGAELVARFDREKLLELRPELAPTIDADNSAQHLSVRLGHGGPVLQLFLQGSLQRKTPTAHPHLAVRVDADEIDSFMVRLLNAGVPFDGPRQLGGPGHGSVYFADPWGQLLELVATDYRGETKAGPPEVARLGHAWG